MLIKEIFHRSLKSDFHKKIKKKSFLTSKKCKEYSHPLIYAVLFYAVKKKVFLNVSLDCKMPRNVTY